MNVDYLGVVMSRQSGDLGRIRWLCRRGMLELDKLLLDFFDHGFDQLSTDEAAQFELMLAESDPQLYRWLLGFEVPQNPQWAQLVRKIIDG